MQSYNKLFIKQLFFNTENGDEVRKKTFFLSQEDILKVFFDNIDK